MKKIIKYLTEALSDKAKIYKKAFDDEAQTHNLHGTGKASHEEIEIAAIKTNNARKNVPTSYNRNFKRFLDPDRNKKFTNKLFKRIMTKRKHNI